MALFIKDKVTLITGGTNGIGKATAFELSRQGALVLIVSRSAQKCSEVAKEIQTSTGNPVDWIAADLSSLDGIMLASTQFMERHNQLHVLINNAGAYFNHRFITKDGFEMTFALNHLNYFLLTSLLLDVLKSSQPSRIVNVSSLAHASLTDLDLDNLQGEKSFNGWAAYSRSKLCNLLFTYELARLINGFYVTVNALHPGYVDSGFGMNNGIIFKLFAGLGAKLFAKKPQKGAQTSIFLATSPNISGVSGKYFSNCKEINSSKLSYDEYLASRLWQKSRELTTKEL
jgi:NAD(P)-dependent dehydrogenase (short-subunit alcohol dehydrogenase family)